MENTERILAKLGEYNLLVSILTLPLTNYVKFNFGKSCLLSDSHTNTVISDALCLPVKMASKTLIRPILVRNMFS